MFSWKDFALFALTGLDSVVNGSKYTDAEVLARLRNERNNLQSAIEILEDSELFSEESKKEAKGGL